MISIGCSRISQVSAKSAGNLTDADEDDRILCYKKNMAPLPAIGHLNQAKVVALTLLCVFAYVHWIASEWRCRAGRLSLTTANCQSIVSRASESIAFMGTYWQYAHTAHSSLSCPCTCISWISALIPLFPLNIPGTLFDMCAAFFCSEKINEIHSTTSRTRSRRTRL